MKLTRILVAVAVVLLFGRVGLSAGNNVVFELGVANISPSSSSSADWGWWNPGKYVDWDADSSSVFVFSDARLLVSGTTYTIILDGEWFPTLDAVGTAEPASGEGDVVQDLSLKTSAYDLGIGVWMGSDRRTGVMPWVGATYLRISEDRATAPPPGSTDPEIIDDADSDLWGVVIGADASYQVWSTLDVTGRVLVRWATGTRRARVSPQDPGAGGASGGTAETSDSIDSGMWGVDLGLRWNASKSFWLELGWRYRNQTYDDGPATYGGPQIKAAYRFRR